jgi:hypothetical protein
MSTPSATSLPRLALVLLLAAAPAAAAGHPADATRRLPLQLHARAVGELIEVEGSEERAELLTFGEGLVDGLLMVGFEEEVAVADWPVGPGERTHVRLTRRDVYAPDAVIWELTAEGRRQVPRSTLVFLWGVAEADEDVRVMVSVDPETQELRGFSIGEAGPHLLQPTPPGMRDQAGQYLVGPPDMFLDSAGRSVDHDWSCGQSGVSPELRRLTARAAADGLRLVTAAAGVTTLHTATVAVDTDNELMSVKFLNNTTNAGNYVASLIAAMNVIYERDLLVRLVQGTTFLRTAADPYDELPTIIGPPGCATECRLANGAQLGEFDGEWSLNQGAVSRALAMMLSGKGHNPAVPSTAFSSSGIAAVNALCDETRGYSFTQVFTFAGATADHDVFVVAHELGHNFGSPHTHCYSPPIDNCRSGEGPGCFSGTQACPTPPQNINGVPNVTGTLMSYCHLLGGGCTSSNVFHPTTEDLLDDIILAHTSGMNACVFPLLNVSGVTPASGFTTSTTPVIVTGAGFQGGATVAFGGTPATSVVVVDSTTITAVAPLHAAGIVAVEVTNPTMESAERANGFFYYTPPTAGDFFTLAPCRVIDTRNANGPLGGPVLAANQERTFDVDGTCGIPATAKAISINVTAVTPAAGGSVDAYPGNAFPLGTNVVSFDAGLTRAASAIVPLATSGTGTIGIRNGSAGSTHLVIDVNGYFE